MTTQKRFRRFSSQGPDFSGVDEVLEGLKSILLNPDMLEGSTLMELVDFQTPEGSFCLLEDRDVSSDARVDFYYVPTYLGAAIFMREYLSPNPLISKDLTKSVLERALKVSLGRGLKGHGYDGEQGLLEALSIFRVGGLREFLRVTRTFCPEFHLLVWNTIDKRSQRLKSAGIIKGAWDEDYTDQWHALLADIKPERRLYLAYGSNMASQQMLSRCPESRQIGSTHLEDWQLEFHHFANIEKAQGARTPTVIWEISERDEATLDRFEGVPRHYYKHNLLATVDGTLVSVMVYLMTDWKKNEAPSAKLKPESGYLDTIRTGYSEHGFEYSGCGIF